MKKLMRMMQAVVVLAIVASTMAVLRPEGASAAASSFKFSSAWTGIQAQILAAVFNTSTGHSHDGTDSRQLSSSALASASVNTAKLDVAAVTTVKIANGAVDTAKLATDSVTNAKVLKGSIDTTKLVAGTAVDTGKLTCGKPDGKIGLCGGFTRSPNAWECDCN